MREVIGQEFWEAVSKEHIISGEGNYYGSNSLQLERIDVFYNENFTKKYTPKSIVCCSFIPSLTVFFYYRIILVDLEPATLSNVRSSAYSRLLRSSSFINAQPGADGSLEKECYTEDTELVEQILNVVRKEAELADC
ncbi:unnamed protein product [Rhizopus microsporus]|nr:hypothetical protein RMCBS344292_19160 [Rhizopus microsporus]